MTKENAEIDAIESRFTNPRLDYFWKESLWVIEQYIHIPTRTEFEGKIAEIQRSQPELSKEAVKDVASGHFSQYKTDTIEEHFIADQLLALLTSMSRLQKDLPDPIANAFVDDARPFAIKINRWGYTSGTSVQLFDADMQKLILKSPALTEVEELAKQKGLTTLLQDAFIKVLDGLTSVDEVLRVIGE